MSKAELCLHVSGPSEEISKGFCVFFFSETQVGTEEEI
jgi:hypothetical protein